MPNQLLDLYRQQSQDPRSDDDIILEVAEKLPAALEQPDFKADYERILAAKNPKVEPYQPTVGDYFGQVYGELVRGATRTVADLPQSAATLARLAPVVGEPVAGALESVGGFVEGVGEKITPMPLSELEDSFWASKLPAGIGSTIGFFGGGVAGKAMKVPAWIATATLGAASGAQGGFDDAKAHGANDKEAYLAFLFNGIVGTSEAIPLAKLVNKLDGLSGNTFSKTLIDAGKSTFEEALQEAVQQFSQNVFAKKLYDEDRALLKDVADGAKVGGVSGFLVSLLASGLGAKARGQAAQDLPGASPSSTPAGQPPATAAPADALPAAAAPLDIPVPKLPEGMETYTEKLDGTQHSEAELKELSQIARTELDGGLTLQDQKLLQSLDPGTSAAYLLVKQNLEAERAVQTAANQTDTNPTEAQKESGSYKKGKVELDGMTIAIENPQGSERSGKDSDGETWSVTMPAHYGYILGTKGRDKDHLDIYVGPQAAAENVFVVNQIDPRTGNFDEHKILYGFDSEAAATQAYDAAFSDGTGPQRRGSVTAVTKDQFQTWLKEGDTKKPLGELPPRAPQPEPQPEPSPKDLDYGLGGELSSAPEIPAAEPKRAGPAIEAPAPTPEPPAVVAAAPTAEKPPEVALREPQELLDRIDMAKAEETRTNGGLKERSFFDVEPGQKFSIALAEKLVSNAKATNRAETKQVTFFEAPDGQVFGLGVAKTPSANGELYYKVTPPPGTPLRPHGRFKDTAWNLEQLMAAGYSPIGSLTLERGNEFKYSDRSKAARFANRAEYDAFRAQAFGKIDAQRAENAARQDAMTHAVAYDGDSESGEAVKVAVAVAPLDLEQEFYETIVDFLPVDPKTRKIRKDLSVDDIKDVVANAMADPESGKSVWTGFLMLLQSITSAHPDFAQQVKGELVENGAIQDALIRILSEKIHESYKSAYVQEGKTGFAETLERLLQGTVSKPNANRIEAPKNADAAGAAGAKPAALPAATASASGADTRPAGAAAQSGLAGKAGEQQVAAKRAGGTDPSVRYHAGDLEARHRPTLNQVAAAFNNTLVAVARSGLDVTVLQTHAANLTQEMGAAASGAITLAMENVSQPTATNLYHLNAEVAHRVFAGLSNGQRGALQDAVRKASDAFLGITTDFAVSPAVANPSDVLQEERLVDTVARAMVREGFNLAESRGFAEQFWGTLKQLLLRTAMAVSNTLGLSNLSSRIATDYLRHRVESFLSGNWQPLSVAQFAGMEPVAVEHQSSLIDAANGRSAATFRFDPVAGVIQVETAVPESAAAIFSNLTNPTVRYHGARGTTAFSPETGPEHALYDIAATNEFNAILQRQFAIWNASGANVTTTGQPAMTEEDYFRWVLGPNRETPAETLARLQQMAGDAGQQLPNPATRMADLNVDAQREVASRVYLLTSRLQASLQKRHDDNAEELSGEPGSEQRQLQRSILSTIAITTKYDNTSAVMAEVQANLAALMKHLRTDINRIGRMTHRRGAMAEIIKELDGDFTVEIGKSYELAMNRLVKEFTDSPAASTKFVDALAKLSDMPVAFHLASVRTIKNFIRNSSDPDFDILNQSTPDSRALLAIAAAFAKRNALLVDMVSLRRMGQSDALTAEKIALNEAIKIAMGTQRSSVDDARRHISKLTAIKVKADRILSHLEEIRARKESLMASIAERQRFNDMHEKQRVSLAEEQAAYERVIGAVLGFFEATPGELHYVPETPQTPPDLVLKTTKAYATERDGRMDRELREDIQKKEAWLEHHATTPWFRSALYNRIEMEVEKLKANDIGGTVDRGASRMITRWAGSIVQKLENTGTPELKQLGRMFRNWQSWHDRYKEDTYEWSAAWSKAFDKARKSLGYSKSQFDVFKRTYYDASLQYISKRLDLQASAVDAEDAINKAIAAVSARYPALTSDQMSALTGLLRETAKVSGNFIKASEAMGNRVWDDKAQIYRKARGVSLFESMRHLGSTIERVWNEEMQGRPGKLERFAAQPIDVSQLQAEYQQDANAAKAKYAAWFSGKGVWDVFLGGMVEESAKPYFHGPSDSAGVRQLARSADIKAAYSSVQRGDVIGFAEQLYLRSGGQTAGGMTQDQFVRQTMESILAQYNWLTRMFGERSAMAGRTMTAMSQALMNSREFEDAPAAWLEYRPFDLASSRALMNQLTLHAAFGRNLESAARLVSEADNRFANDEDVLKREVYDPVNATPGINHNLKVRKMVQAMAASKGLNLERMELASKQRAILSSEWNRFLSFVQASGGVSMDFKWWSQLMGAFVAMTVQGPKTALIDTSSFFKPIQELGLSDQSLKWAMDFLKHDALQGVGGILEAVGITIKGGADRTAQLRDMGFYPTSDQVDFRTRVLTQLMGEESNSGVSLGQRVLRAVGHGAVRVRESLSTPLKDLVPGASSKEDSKFVKVKPAAFTWISQMMHLGSITSTWDAYEDMTLRAARWLANPGRSIELNDPAFRFRQNHAKFLGYGDKFFGVLANEKAFGLMLDKLEQNGLTLEQMAKDLIARGMQGRVLSESAYRRLAVMGPTELLQNSSVVSSPSWIALNPVVKAALPLMPWSITQMNSVDRVSGRSISGEYDGWKNFVWKMAPMIGVGLGYALLSDLWDEEILKKKSNRLSFSGDNAAAALVDKLSVAGTFGLLGEFANSLVNYTTAREFTLDSRVFTVSSIQGITRALSTYYHQGSASYSTVVRPVLQSIGGNGALQYLQVANSILGFDNPESRATIRLNANNWLRVAGREGGLTVKTARGGDYVPNAMTPAIREMVLAAYANDYRAFATAHREAILAAVAEKKQNPADAVKRSFQAQHPLRSIFQTVPAESEYKKMLISMPVNGRRDVMSAISLFNEYGKGLGLEPFDGAKERDTNPLGRLTILKSASAGLLGSF